MLLLVVIIGVLAAFMAGVIVGAVVENRLVRRVISNADKLRASPPTDEKHMTNPYTNGEDARTKYSSGPGSMWGPMPKDQGGD